MFFEARVFNGELSDWDVGHVTNMNNMVNGARSFNGDLSKWNARKVTRMQVVSLESIAWRCPCGMLEKSPT